MSGDLAVEAEGLERVFKGGIRAVDGVDLAVARGEVYGFLGPNGAGKSTTVRMLATLLTPTGGHASVAGHDLVGDPGAVRRSIGVALQDAAIDPYMTGRELLHLQAVLHGFARQRGRRRAVELLARVDLVEAADRRVGTYSGGMRRRLDLALALVHEPEVLFLDEPTTGLDPISRLTLWDEVRRLNGDGHHRVPHHPVPGGGRPARRARGDHRRRADRGRGDAHGAEGRGRRPDAPRRRRGSRRRRARRGGAEPLRRGRPHPAGGARRAAAGRRVRGGRRRAGPGRGGRRRDRSRPGPADPGRRLRGQDRPAPRGRDPRGGRAAAPVAE